MYNRCCVVNCNSRRKDVKLYQFPKTEIGLAKWLQCINCPTLNSLSLPDLRKQHVCVKHFEKRFLASLDPRPRLRGGAYPTLFSKNEISTGIAQTSNIITTDENCFLDHDYSKKRKHEDHTYCMSVNTPVKLTRTETSLDIPSTSKGNVEAVPVYDSLPSMNRCENKSPKKSLEEGLQVCFTPKSRKCISNRKSLTPNCKKLYREYTKARRQLNFTRRAKRAMKFSKHTSFEKLTVKMNPIVKKIMWMQIKQCTKKSNGRRFTDEEKLIALSVMKQGPKCYRFLQRIFILPSKHTLNQFISELNIEPGINPQVLEAVKEKVNNWKENKKYSSILFDEMSIESALAYDGNRDVIDGFVELNAKTNDFADHALVFMVRGAIYKWQQPLLFYFCKGSTSAIELKNIIKNVVIAVSSTGLIPITLVCDQGTAFQSALKSLQSDRERGQVRAGDKIDGFIEINSQLLLIIYDAPHLIKGIRNNFIMKNIKFDNKISKWDDIVQVYKTDCNHAQMRLLPKLNDEHVIPEKIKKMKVKNCTRVFSKSVASALAYTAQFSQYADGTPVSDTIKNTAEIVSFFDDLFDSINGASLYNNKNKGKPLRQAVTRSSIHHVFWEEGLRKLKHLRFLDNAGKEIVVPSLKNFITTIENYQKLWQFFKQKDIKILRPRYFNSDPIENFFGQVRAYNFRNNDPSCHTFKTTFRSLLITRFIKFHEEGFNCEEDSGEQLLQLKSLFKAFTKDKVNAENDSSGSSAVIASNSVCVTSNNSECVTTALQERQKIHSRAYTTGWVIRKILSKYDCQQCEANLTSNDSHCGQLNIWIAFKEFPSKKKNKKLKYPSEYAVKLFGACTEEANKYLEKNPQEKNIKEIIKHNIISKYSVDFLNCEIHKASVLELFLELTLRLIIHNWCNIINKLLKGTDVFRLANKPLPAMQEKAFKYYCICLRV